MFFLPTFAMRFLHGVSRCFFRTVFSRCIFFAPSCTRFFRTVFHSVFTVFFFARSFTRFLHEVPQGFCTKFHKVFSHGVSQRFHGVFFRTKFHKVSFARCCTVFSRCIFFARSSTRFFRTKFHKVFSHGVSQRFHGVSQRFHGVFFARSFTRFC
jgi:hypothetical protein